MSCRNDIPKEILRQVLRYDPETGDLHWSYSSLMSTKWNGRYVGKLAFTATHSEGYKIGKIMGKSLRAHRVAWLLYYGDWPAEQIDHIDGVRTNNVIGNLRSVTNAQNSRNRAKTARNKSGHVGVRAYKNGKWIAEIGVNGKTIYLGVYAVLSDAIAARAQTANAMGHSARHGQ